MPVLSYSYILSSIKEAELLLRIDKKFNAENYILEIKKILEKNGLVFNDIVSNNTCIHVDNKNLDDWVFENVNKV